ncbi:DUF3427 domain-containing protein [Corynebacterium aquatimens]|nr:DUF3427 domain-containing protein [Corynebacterium sp. CNCTC7651]QYH20428.1 DUF3427 domain-containing protein [Corynebacterium aquatimens]UIZ92923.1 DUF3427 domain-containing protein [Corynebacterium sp. CNCTC7651]
MTSRANEALPEGVYETAVTRRIRERIAATENADPFTRSRIAPVDEDLQERYTEAITRVIAEHLAQKLSRTKTPLERVGLINALAQLIDPDDAVESEELLYAVYKTGLGDPPAILPTPLTGASLLTNANNDLSMAAEIKREIRTADSVDLLCAFIKNSGISVIRDQLEYLRDNQIPLRVITSTYCGASEIQAINRLVEEFGAQVKVGYESQDTRLHAKAWLFRRNSGFDTAYIGSSNLSSSALIDGVEWNVRASRTAAPAILNKFEAVFDTYWKDSHYPSYVPSQDQARLKQSLQIAKRGTEYGIELSGLRVEPFPYQDAMLEALAAERRMHGRHRNLIVAATGTGKTVVAALDYRRMVEESKRYPTLLFVAHRNELLKQAVRTYREVLQDPNFGERLDGYTSPSQGTQVFATIQSLSKVLDSFAPDHFDIVVIDEFHHAEASTYRKLLDYVQPAELLGLTATPERGDGINVQSFFNYRVAYELRLWDALQLGLVAPMHYYGVNDETDLSDVKWSRTSKAYNVADLSEFYIKLGDSRVRLVLNELRKRQFDLDEVKALGFCVSIDHAEYMANRFSAFGVPSAAITSRTDWSVREKAITDLRHGTLKALFTVDLFNEGVDIPEVNTLLMLRPTESPIVFLQQLGRGLRKRPGKVCTVLDFIGEQHKLFDFHARFSALVGKRGTHLAREVEDEFPNLPGGSSIQLDRVTQERVLRNIRQLANPDIRKVRSLVEQEATTNLSQFLANTGLQIEDIYRNRKQGGWTRLLRTSNVVGTVPPNELEDFLLGRLRSFLHVDDPVRADAYASLVAPGAAPYSSLSECDRAFARMLVIQFFGRLANIQPPTDWDAALELIRAVPSIADELSEIFSYQLDRAAYTPLPLSGPGQGVLFTHAHYSVGEMTAALSQNDLPTLLNIPREGETFISDSSTVLIFVTLEKDARNFNENRRYKDYPTSADSFHWISPATVSLTSKKAERYLNGATLGITNLLSVRTERNSSIGTANAYQLLGQVDPKSHTGEKPIQIDWALRRPMPAELFAKQREAI